ncbi:SHOCT-like domain-containing protein [Vallitalea sp.]|jgi:hypothetical protein|uniref:SHOCT-like domain-containing protein n=1 Tax=Vallitalea sp. TaxID=1882829 RepID=UPI0025D718C9|nr:hypothetical protein [Vallitalea sp.]MCT4688637.1 hypothetical protein [Vallitalea sp.]
MSEEKKILEMIEKGQITAEEGMELLQALRDVDIEQEENIIEEYKIPVPKREFKFLRIKVITEKGETKVNVNIPIKLIKALGGILPQANNLIPEDVKSQMNEKGINLGSIDVNKILSALESGELEDTVLVDVETYDEEDGKTQVKIYVE